MSALTTAAVALVVVLVVLGAAYWVYRDRKAGRTSCGCTTSSCAGCSACPPQTAPAETSAEESPEAPVASEPETDE